MHSAAESLLPWIVSRLRVAVIIQRVLALAIGLLSSAALNSEALEVLAATGGVTAVIALGLFLTSSVALGHASVWIASRVAGRDRNLSSWLSPLAWLAMALGASAFWPTVLMGGGAPARSLWTLSTCMALPAVLADRGAGGETTRRWIDRWRGFVIGIGLAAGTVAMIRYALAVRQGIESVDFYFYVAVARDLAAGVTDVSLARYGYFPGVYTFWRLALRAGHGSLGVLQWTYLALLAANALALAGIVARVSRSMYAGIFAALWYGVVCLRFEGFAGATEPLGSLPLLIALLVWGGVPLAGARGMGLALVLGGGIGLAVYARQQAALLALGWLWIAMFAVMERSEDRTRRLAIALVPPIAISVLLGLVLLEGDGLEPLRRGLVLARDYGRQAGFFVNARGAGIDTEPLIYAALITLVVTPALAMAAVRRGGTISSWLTIAGFSITAGSAALVQLASRPYSHYVLLAAPFLIIAVVLGSIALVRDLDRRLHSAAMTFFGVAIAAVPLASLWASLHFGTVAYPTPWRQNPDVAGDLATLRAAVRPTEDLLVIPPRRNEVHLTLGTRSISYEDGYGWGPHRGSPRRALGSSGLRAVVVIRATDEADRAVCQSLDCDDAITALPAAGFRPVAELKTMTLWRR